MQYMGGKTRLAKRIAATIASHRGDRCTYLEPFLGGASVAAVVCPLFERSILSDSQPDIALLWDAVVHGWEPPAELSREEYGSLRHADPSPLRAFAGFGCSFGGKWFGGYAACNRGDNYPQQAHNSIKRKARGLIGAEVRRADYSALDDEVTVDCVVYCDPPYIDTTSYSTGVFDHAEFWRTAERWALRGALVLVSEYRAPAGWVPVWEVDLSMPLAKDGNAMRSRERLYTHLDTALEWD